MPVGEDIPMLIPISIVLVVFLLFLFALFANFSEKSEIVKMSQTTLDIGEYIINIQFAEEYGISSPPQSQWGCRDISELNISPNYKTKINITNLETGRWWCWGDISNSKEIVTNNLPTLIIENGKTIPALVSVSVGK